VLGFNGQILAKEYGEFNYLQLTRRLTVDTYAVQYPGKPGRQSVQSICMHLISLHLVLVKGLDGKTATKKLSEIKAARPAFEWSEPTGIPVKNFITTWKEKSKFRSKISHQ